jgi:transcriptional regulator with XRE-family HTH domain
MIGKRIKLLRTEKDVTQKELADFLGLTPKMISFYEKGERFPPHDIISKLSDYFNVTTDYLLCKTDKKNTSDEIDEEKDIEKAIDELLQQDDLMLCGQIADEDDLIALRNSLRLTIDILQKKNEKNKKKH